MTRCAAILALFVCGWAAGCGAPEVPDAASANAGRREEPTDADSRSATADPLIVASEAGSDLGWHLPVPALAYNAREGKAVFQHYCEPCHGETGRGDGFNAYNLDPRPRDLADSEFQQARTDEDLAAVVRTGGGVAGLSNSMPPWGRTLSERQIHNLVRFLRSLPGQIDQESAE